MLPQRGDVNESGRIRGCGASSDLASPNPCGSAGTGSCSSTITSSSGRINCRREFNQVEKASFNPIIVCDKPWERGEGWYIERMTLIDDPHYGLLRTWYETIKTYKDRPSETYMCYATSQDGVHWHKPNLGIVEFDGSKDNNIVAHPKSEASSMRWFDLDPREKRPITQVQESWTRGAERSVHPQILG